MHISALEELRGGDELVYSWIRREFIYCGYEPGTEPARWAEAAVLGAMALGSQTRGAHNHPWDKESLGVHRQGAKAPPKRSCLGRR